MPTFEDVYTIPNLAYEISSYLNVDDELNLDQVSKTIHATNREWVYGMYRDINVDEMIEQSSSIEAALKYLKKISPYIETLTFNGNVHEVKLPPVDKLPNLRSIEFAVPLVVDVSWRSISPSTHILWKGVRDFITSLTKTPNKVERIRIVPGVVKFIQTPHEQPDNRVEESVLDDRSPESHLRMYRHLQMPIVLWPDWSKLPNLKEFHAPLELIAYAPSKELDQMKNLRYTDWQRGTAGVLYMASQLFGF